MSVIVSIGHYIGQSVNQSDSILVSISVSQYFSIPVSQYIGQSVYQSIVISVSQHISKSVYQLVSLSVSISISLLLLRNNDDVPNEKNIII